MPGRCAAHAHLATLPCWLPAAPLQGSHLYYGAFTGGERGVLGEPTSLWVVAAPFPEQQQQGAGAAKEWLLQLDAEGGRELGRVQVRACHGRGRAAAGLCVRGGQRPRAVCSDRAAACLEVR